MRSASWFAALGAPLGAAEEADVAAYLDGLGCTGTPQLVTSWDEAKQAILQSPDAAWWGAEEALRKALEARVRLNPADPAWIAMNDILHGAAAVAAMRFGCSDAGLIKAAAGAASFAAHQAELAGPDEHHPFRRKYALFAGGRWPLGLYGARFAIF